VTKEPCFKRTSAVLRERDGCSGFLRRGNARRYWCPTMRRIQGPDLSFGTVAERNAPESLTPGDVPLRSPQHIAQIAFFGTRSSFAQATERRKFLKQEAWPSRIRRAKESTGIRASGENHEEHRVVIPERCVSTRPGISRFSGAQLRTTVRRFTSPRNDGRRQFVFATRGGVAVVMNCVAWSMATPSGVGITMRNGTRIRVPSTGAKAISMFRAAARYLITGRSGI